MTSRFGDFPLGDYNVLPLDHKDMPPYIPPKTMDLARCPDASPLAFTEDQLHITWDLQVTRSEAEKTLPLADAYTRMENLWTWRRDQVDHVHQNWDELPKWDTNWSGYSKKRRAAWISVLPAGFIGTLVAQAPLVHHSTAQQGPATETWETQYAVTVSSTTTEGYEFGLSAEAGVNAKGVDTKRTASFKWSKSTTDTTSVTKSDKYAKTVPVAKDYWGRQDVRACAGVYTGWLVYRYKRENETDRLAVYPMRAPVHVPGVVDPVATHHMSCPVNKLTPEENRLMQEQARLTAELSADGHRPHDPSGLQEKIDRLSEIRDRLTSL
ncbi:hypothetical protein [Streptomyces sp. enrichment culture]|uniref:hypothetical protein n=1 Tax=Streptomyces sp. enrichment culture TaxID=1795815 RepID=UPI003F57C3AC